MKKPLFEMVFWGSLWGIAEVTLGYVFHIYSIFLPGLPGFLMFPIAFYFMRRAYTSSAMPEIIIGVAMVASTLKLLDFLMPGNDPIRILNPALSILLEGVAVMMVIKVVETMKWPLGYLASFTMGVLWRAAFLGYMSIIALYDIPAGLVTSGLAVSLRFLILESIVNACIMSLMVRYDKARQSILNPGRFAFPVLVFATILQLVF